LVEFELFDGELENFNYLFPCVLFELRRAGSHLRHEVSIIHLLVSLGSVRVTTRWNSDYFVVSILKIALVTEENVKCAVFEDNNKFVGIGSLLISFKPADMIDLATLFYLF